MVSKSWQLGSTTVNTLPWLLCHILKDLLKEPWQTRLRETTKLGVISYFCTGKKPPLTKKLSTLFCSTPGLPITFIVMSSVCGDAFFHFVPVFRATRVPPSSPRFPKPAFPHKKPSQWRRASPARRTFLGSPAAERSGPPALTAFSLVRGRG